MKNLSGILVGMVMVLFMSMPFISCERQNGHMSRSGQRAELAERAKDAVKAEQIINNDTNVVVRVIEPPLSVLVDNGVMKYKTKVIECDSTVCFVLTSNKFEVGEKIKIKSTQRLQN